MYTFEVVGNAFAQARRVFLRDVGGADAIDAAVVGDVFDQFAAVRRDDVDDPGGDVGGCADFTEDGGRDRVCLIGDDDGRVACAGEGCEQ